MKEIFILYKKYLTWLEGQNRAIKARNGKRVKRWNKPLMSIDTLEKEIEPTLNGFLVWGANHETT